MLEANTGDCLNFSCLVTSTEVVSFQFLPFSCPNSIFTAVLFGVSKMSHQFAKFTYEPAANGLHKILHS
jgi:hypothetical protein